MILLPGPTLKRTHTLWMSGLSDRDKECGGLPRISSESAAQLASDPKPGDRRGHWRPQLPQTAHQLSCPMSHAFASRA